MAGAGPRHDDGSSGGGRRAYRRDNGGRYDHRREAVDRDMGGRDRYGDENRRRQHDDGTGTRYRRQGRYGGEEERTASHRRRQRSRSRSRSPVRRRGAPASKMFARDTAVSAPSSAPEREVETNARRLQQRQKQIDYGKNTASYDRYLKAVPKHKRRRGQPVTPDKTEVMSKRAWDGRVRAWRRALHAWDGDTASTPHVAAAAVAAPSAVADVTSAGSASSTTATAEAVGGEATKPVFDALADSDDDASHADSDVDAALAAELEAFEDDDLL